MNEIRVKRLVLAGLATFVVWVAIEILLEGIIGRILFGGRITAMWLESTDVGHWSARNYALNILIALLNSTVLIWLYASLRPMYGVGTKTALITSALGVFWTFSLAVNGINLGLFPAEAALVEAVYEAIEFPGAMIVGATVYEGTRAPNPT